MDWINGYVGIPYLKKGRTRAGCDCWGLVRLILLEQFGFELPSFEWLYDGSIQSAAGGVSRALDDLKLRRVESPQIGDIVVMTIRGLPAHVGLYVGDGCVIHTLFSHDSAVQRISGLKIVFLEGYYRVE